MDERQLVKAHKISLNNRSFGLVTGVREVISFDALEIILDTEQGILILKGEDLHVTRLTVDKGEVEVTGKVDCMMYSDVEDRKRSRESLLTRLFQ